MLILLACLAATLAWGATLGSRIRPQIELSGVDAWPRRAYQGGMGTEHRQGRVSCSKQSYLTCHYFLSITNITQNGTNSFTVWALRIFTDPLQELHFEEKECVRQEDRAKFDFN